MDIDTLYAFLVVYRSRSITKAASILHISQPALSRKIKALEDEMGVPLLNRGSRYVELTAAGTRVVADAEKIVRRQQRMMKDMEFYRDGSKLRISFVPKLDTTGIFSVVTAARENCPDMKIKYISCSFGENTRMLLSKEVDIAYIMHGEIEDVPEIEHIHLISNDLTVIVPRGHRLWSKNSVSCEELSGEHFIIHRIDSLAETITESKVLEFLAQKVNGGDIISHFSSPEEVLLHVCEGDGIAIAAVYGAYDSNAGGSNYRKILINDFHVEAGDMVLAYWKGNERAREFISNIKGKIDICD